MPIINNKVHRTSVSNLSNLEVPWIVQEQNGWSGYARILHSKQSNPPLTHFSPKYNPWMLGWFHQLTSIPDGEFILPPYIHPEYVVTLPYHTVFWRVV